MLELNDNKDVLEGALKLSDCERHNIVKWLSGSPQASFYVGDKQEVKDEIYDFINGEHVCKVNLNKYKKYLLEVQSIVIRYSSMYHGPTNEILNVINRFNNEEAEYFNVVMYYLKDDRYIRIMNDKRDYSTNVLKYGDCVLKNGTFFRNSFVGGITKIKIIKNVDEYEIELEVLNNWRDILMQENGSKLTLEVVVDIFNEEMESKISEGFEEKQAAQIFGIKYGPLIKNNSGKFNIDEIVNSSNHNSNDSLEGLKNGIEISPAILWEKGNDSSFDDNDENGEYDPNIKGFNRIYYGAPGCGKSRLVKKKLEKVPYENKIRVTFHPEYSNFDFVGQVLPTIKKGEDDKDIVEYIFNKGPFVQALEKAFEEQKNGTGKMVYLVIEEINRGNAAAIFGDLFQLLDRDDNGNSEYPVSNTNIIDRLVKDGYGDYIKEGVYIPYNLTILATMNTSDQNVFTLDTAFKRRWEFEQISNDFTDEDKNKDLYVPGTSIKWSKFVQKINKIITDPSRTGLSGEDKRIGKYFVKSDYLVDSDDTRNYNPTEVEDVLVKNEEIISKSKAFAYKILEYIWNDVAKFDEKSQWFDTSKNHTLEELIASFVSEENNDNPLAVFIGIDDWN